jgi:hypothetical protein
VSLELRVSIVFSLMWALSGPVLLSGELPEVEWEVVLGGPSNDLANSVLQTADGGYIVAGRRTAELDFDLHLVRLNAAGAVVWTRTIGGPGDDLARSVEETEEGGYIAAGARGGTFFLVRLDPNGEVQWERSYGSGLGWAVRALEAGFAATGTRDGDVYLLRTDAAGDVVWERRFGGAGGDVGTSLDQAPDGGFAVAGYSRDPSREGSLDAYLAKTDRTGELEWQALYGGEGLDWAEGVVVTVDGDLVATGSSAEEFYLFKVGGQGKTVWERRLGSVESNGLWPTADGGYVLGGLRRSPIHEDAEPRVVRTDGGGKLLWSRLVLRPDETGWFSAVQETRDRGFILAGSTRPRSTPYFDIYVVKLSAERLARRSFVRGDSNADGRADVSDAVYLLNWLFLSGPAPPCEDAADADDDGELAITDAIALLNALFVGAGALRPPYPEPGVDPTLDGLGCDGPGGAAGG